MKEETTIKCIKHNRLAHLCDHGGHYTIYAHDEDHAMEDIKRVFPTGKANDMNWFIASTSGVHGTYETLDDIEEQLKNPNIEEYGEDYIPTLTFQIIMPRMVCVSYGNVQVKNQDDVDYLRGLISSTVNAIADTQYHNISKSKE